MPKRVTETIGCDDGHVMTVHAGVRGVAIEFDGHHRDLSPTAWRRLSEVVETALHPSVPHDLPSSRGKRAHYGVTVGELVKHGCLHPGDVITFKRPPHTEAIITDNGTIEVLGVEYNAPAPAGSAVNGGKPSDGWNEWLLGDKPLFDIRAEYMDQRSTSDAF